MSQDEQATPTPRTDSTIGADKFVPAWKVRKDMGQLERELSAAKVEAFELSLNPDIAEYAALRAEAERLREALEKVERWQFPPTGKFWESGTPVSYGAAYGSNGERDYMRNVARAALAATRKEDSGG